MPPLIKPYPDIEALLVNYLQSFMGENNFGSDYRICTILPEKVDRTSIRVTRISGTNRTLVTDRPIVDVDVFAFTNELAKGTAEMIADNLNAVRNLVTPDGIIQQVVTVNRPRWLPDINQDLFRFSATYEPHTHGA